MRSLYSSGDRLSRAQAKRRRLLLDSAAAQTDDDCYLWRHHATTGVIYKDRYDVYVPSSGNRFACFGFKDTYGNGVMNFAQLREALPIVNTPHGSLTKTGTWNVLPESQAYNGSTAHSSSSAVETISGSIAGHTLILRAWMQSSGGYGVVTIDGDPTAANRCPRVTQAQVDAGYFAAADLGKCYVRFHAAAVHPDEHVVLAEGLSDVPHTVSISAVGAAQIPPPGSTNKYLFVSALAGARYATKPTDAGGSMGFTRDIGNMRGGHSATAQVVSFAPEGFLANAHFLGENHLNESQSAGEFRVDGVVASPAPGAYVSGKTIVLDRTTTLNHPNAAACATKRTVFTAAAGAGMQLVARGVVAWHKAGEAGDSYFGMLPVFTRNLITNALENVEFNRGLVGDQVVGNLGTSSGVEQRVRGADLLAVFSTEHDTVAVAHMPRADLNVNNFLKSQPTHSFIRDVLTGGTKGYFSRSSASSKESIAPGVEHAFEAGWRILRVPRAAQLLQLAE